jgi:ketosteroid isomerase-like protein
VAGVHPNELLARREIELISQGDVEGLRHLYADDCVFHYPGKSPLAGTHRGVSAFMAKLDAVFAGATIRVSCTTRLARTITPSSCFG